MGESFLKMDDLFWSHLKRHFRPRDLEIQHVSDVAEESDEKYAQIAVVRNPVVNSVVGVDMMDT